MAEEGEQDDVSFLRTDDMVCLQCTATGGRVCLAAEGFGNRHCYLENIADKNYPPEMSCCVFVIEQALSVRALQEMVTAANNDSGTSQSGHRTLLYGHAVLLRHQNSGMFLACLSTSSSNDKLAFDVGLREHSQGEACWWTIHPASKQRSEGEKVRVGDELIFVSVATERYLHTTLEGEHAIVNASFHLTHWSVAPFGTGISRIKSVGFVFGGEVLRFYHGGDECLTIPANWTDAPGGNMVIYEGGAVLSQARSLWRLELVRTKWAGGFINWGYPLRVRHITTGRYMAFNDNREVILVTREEASVNSTAFCLRQTKDDKKIVLDEKEEEVIGSPLIKYGDTTVFLQHLETGLWLSYKTYETKKKGVGKVEEKQAIMSEEGKMDDGLEFSRSQEEESKTARVIRKCGALFTKFNTGLDNLHSCPDMFPASDLDEMVTCLEDLIQYFAQPEDDIEHEEKQTKLKALRNRQDLCQEEGILNLILETIDKINVISSQGYLSMGEDTGQRWETISGYLYQLLAAIIKGNHTNCAQFAQAHRLDWLFSRLGSQQAAEGTGMLDVLHCVLIDSPEALNMMKEAHIKVIISLLEKHGRDPKVLDVLCSLCVGNGVAVRSSQNNICDNLLPGRNLLLQTRLVDHVSSMRPNIYVGRVEGAPIYRKWYFEAMVDHLETVSHLEPHFRVGWASTKGYVPYPGPGAKWGGNGVGDDLYSYGFDGAHMWTGGRSNRIRNVTSPFIQKGDVIGCILDLTVPLIRFTVNGVPVPGQFRGFNAEDMFYPVISFSAKLSCRFILGGDQGRLRYGPPDDHSPLVEGVMPNQEIVVESCFQFGDLPKGVLCGPTVEASDVVFVPQPVDTSNVQLPGYIESVRDKLAENIHEVWAMNKIEAGWTYGEVRDDLFRRHPCLTSFERLPAAEKKYDTTLALQTLRTIIALGYHISVDKPPARIKTFKLHNDPFLQSNGYKPAPLDLANITLTPKMDELVEMLAENTHNVWARERISQHWTYGLNEDSRSRRSPHLVPYKMVDEAIKKANRDTASETVRTLLAYGYVLEAPVGDTTEGLPGSQIKTKLDHRTYRAEQTYAVTSGKWYYEFEVLTSGPMKVGWASTSCPPSIAELGADDQSWAFDGYRGHKHHAGVKESYGKQWQVGDVVGCLLDLNDKTIGFSLNGELLLDVLGGEMAFTDLTGEGFVPAFTLSTGQRGRFIFGQDINQLKFFTTCGLQEGFQPFCVNMTRTMAFWYTKEDTQFMNVEDIPEVKVDVIRVPPGGESPPALKICHNQYENVEKVSWEFLRLGLPVTFKEHFITDQEKNQRWEEIRRLQQSQKASLHYSETLKEHMLKSGFSISDVKELQRGYSEDAAEADELSPRGSHTMLMKTRSTDHLTTGDPSMETTQRSLRSATSDDALGKKDHSSDTSPPVEPERKRRGKSPFRFFRKSTEKREPEVTVSNYMNGELVTERKGPVTMNHLAAQTVPLIATPQITERRPSGIKKASSKMRIDAHPDKGDHMDQLDSSCLELLDEYFYGVRIFPGQDPNHVFCGWVATTYKQHDNSAFENSKVRKVTFVGLSEDGTNKEVLERQDCYLVSAGQLLTEVCQESRTSNQGMFVGCHVDLALGTLTFTAEGRSSRTVFRVEPGTKLFPAAFFEATSKEVFQFELGRTPTTLPLSAALLQTTGKHIVPQCPPRLKVQSLQRHSWARVPDKFLRPHALKLSDIRGWSLLCEDPVSMLAVHIPEEDRCIDILELIEHDRLLSFHAHTLVLYGALCFQGNHRAAHTICGHVDAKQLLYAIQTQYLAGPLRLRFGDLLISLHLESFAYARTLTQNEFIIPLGNELKEMYEAPEATHQLTALQSVSLRPEVVMSPIQTAVTSIKDLSTPFFPLDSLKNFVMEALQSAVYLNNFPMRDPIGGSNTCLFVPLIKLVDKLLLIGFLEDYDLESLLVLIDPETFDPEYSPENGDHGPPLKGLMQMQLEEGPKLELCHALHHLLGIQLRHRVEGLVAFCKGFVSELQTDQLRRYISIKQEDLPTAVAARKTKEFRCAPKDQMRAILSFKTIDEEGGAVDQCPCGDPLRESLHNFHEVLTTKMKTVLQAPEEEGVAHEENGAAPSTSKVAVWGKKLLRLIKLFKAQAGEDDSSEEGKVDIPQGPEDQFVRKIVTTISSWAEGSEIESTQLIREMFRLLLRLYNSPGELIGALGTTYVLGEASKADILRLLEDLGRVRSLLPVQMEPEEEEVMRTSLWAMVNNRVFFQHPDLIRILKVYEDVIAVMMNTLGKRAQTSDSPEKDTSHEMVVSCCRFLCFFCRSSRQNQRAMFDQLDFLLDNSNILLSRPSLRGSTPLDVAISSVMENSELALALREVYLEKIAVYLSRCGLQFSQDLLDRGYPDIQWDPVEGERYLDFLKFCVWVNGESVEENANLVIRLLIRRPECLGPALRGEGPGLLVAIKEAIKMSDRIQAENEAAGIVPEEDEDYIDMGAAILNFYCALVDLLGRCAPEAATIAQGKNDCIRARAILKSLVPMEDLEGVLSLRFNLKNPGQREGSDMPTGLQPNHKQSIVLFSERVYGIEDQETFFRLLEDGFLPDLRAATMLEKMDGSESEMALSLNRYIGNSILPTVIKYCSYFGNAELYNNLIEATLHTIYRLSKVKILTKGQRERVSDFLVALTSEMHPSMLLRLLRKLTIDVSALNEYTTVALRLLTLNYERCGKYYGTASEEEKRLTMMLFTNIFDSLAKMEYDPDLFSKALPCLTAIACALPPDYSLLSVAEEDWHRVPSSGPYVPEPIPTSSVQLNPDLTNLLNKFAEHYHDAWASRKFENGWIQGDYWSDERKVHPRLKPYSLLTDREKERYEEPARESLKALLALGWKLEATEASRAAANRPSSPKQEGGYSPQPVDMSNLTLSRDLQTMAERLAENNHDHWARKMKAELDAIGGGIHPQLVPYDLLTDKEKYKYRDRAQELLKFLQYQSLKVYRTRKEDLQMSGAQPEVRFASSLLDKLLHYMDITAIKMKILRPSQNFSRRSSFKTSSRDVKFFSKVVLPLMEKYFSAHRNFFLTSPTVSTVTTAGVATIKEKEMVASLFCKLAGLLRDKMSVVGTDAPISVRCLRVLIQATDAKTIVKNSPDFVKTSMLTFFNNASDDLAQTMANLNQGKFSQLRGTTLKTSSSLTYIQLVLIPVLTALFDHLASQEFGADLLLNDLQVACYKILHSLFTLGTSPDLSKNRKFIKTELDRHRPAVGNCLGAFAGTFPVAFLEPNLNKHNPHCIHSSLEQQSLEAQTVMAELETSLPTLDDLMGQFEKFVTSGVKYSDSPYIIDIILPLLCSYLPFWWSQGPDNVNPTGGNHVTLVTSEHLNTFLTNVFNLIRRQVGQDNAPWMVTLAAHAGQVVISVSEELLAEPVLPLAELLRQRTEAAYHKEEMMRGYLKSSAEDTSQIETQLQEEWNMLVRDIYAFFPLLIKYVDLQRGHWLKVSSPEADTLYSCVAYIFNIWSKSMFFRKEEQNFISQHEIDNMALIMPAAGRGRAQIQSAPVGSSTAKKVKKKRDGKRDKDKELASSLMVSCLKRLLPIGLNLFAGREQELVQHAKEKFLKQKCPETEISEFIKTQLTLPDKIDPADTMSWQHILYSQLGGAKSTATPEQQVDRILDMAKVLQGLHMIDHPSATLKGVTRSLVSMQRKRAVIACFRMISLHSLPRHRAINIYLQIYCDIWLQEENVGQEQLIDDTTESFEVAETKRGRLADKEEKTDPLTQLVVAFSRNATMEHSGVIPEDGLYMEYANIFSKSCGGAEEEEEEEGGGDEEGPSIHEQEMEKQKCLFHQSRLADRGVAEMVLFFLSASKGVQGPMVVETLKCGISLLLGGNIDVQMRMLKHLKEKKDAGFFTSVAALMNSCSVLDLDAFERNQKAEGLGMGLDGSAGKKNMHDAEFTCFLFRFLQLLCEGHNLEFQNYLRTQAGNTTTVNVVISTVDYLLRLQESIMDFYWSYSSKALIDPPGKENFCRAIKVARQVFNTLTEFIQGPCSLNQQALAHSRLWDAVGGFLFLFAHMQDKLSKNASQLDLLRDLLELQKDMVIMMLSMLEGNVVNGTIGKQMVDTLVESAANVELILKFFDMFLKLGGLISSPSFAEYDTKKLGWIAAKDFKRAMEQQKIYTPEEIDYLMSCCEPNHDGLIDYLEFTDRFHNPAKDIGFNLAVLLTNLSEHMPSDPRLSRFLETASSVLNYFEPFLGRIEIMGGANRIERVYFEIKEANIEQWEEPQIKDSKRAFFYSIVTEGGEKGKLEAFVNFCEDAIFEMQHASSISKEDEAEAPTSASQYPFHGAEEEKPPSVLDPVKNALTWLRVTLIAWLSLLTPQNLKAQATYLAGKSPLELVLGTWHLIFNSGYFVGWLLYKVSRTFVRLVLVLMGGEVLQQPEEEEVDKSEVLFKPAALPAPMPSAAAEPLPLDVAPAEGTEAHAEGEEGAEAQAAVASEEQGGEVVTASDSAVAIQSAKEAEPVAEVVEEVEEKSFAGEAAKATEPPPAVASLDFSEYGQKIVSFLARKFYTMKWIALMIAFIINFMLLFYKVTSMPGAGEDGSEELDSDMSGSGEDGLNLTSVLGDDSGEEEDVEEWIVIENELFRLAVQTLSIIHSIVAFCMLVSYYHLKVPLAIFKREKEIARAMEFDGLYITDESGEEDLATKWDRYVVSSRSFPVNYWDKFVKKRVREKYSEMYDYDAITNLLALDTSYSPEHTSTGFLGPLLSVDWRYQVWKAGVTITDKAFLYYLLYFIFSMLGNINSFFFAAHLLDVAVNIKSLKTILQSVTHNGKQLLLTVMLLTIVVYIYTVFAFLFFRKFYVQEEEDNVDQKCHNMFTCFIFHLYKGVRAGGGIGDEIESPDGDDYEFYRIFFDITFFFFVIVILLAIIQGLIIDAFGELRDQLQSVSDDMESSCFICGITKDYFDKVPHGFDTHVQKEHNLANYLFFLMHLINKPDTEYTGQETYVWELYQKRCWDFFPVGDCFRKQYEDTLMGGGPSG